MPVDGKVSGEYLDYHGHVYQGVTASGATFEIVQPDKDTLKTKNPVVHDFEVMRYDDGHGHVFELHPDALVQAKDEGWEGYRTLVSRRRGEGVDFGVDTKQYDDRQPTRGQKRLARKVLKQLAKDFPGDVNAPVIQP